MSQVSAVADCEITYLIAAAVPHTDRVERLRGRALGAVTGSLLALTIGLYGWDLYSLVSGLAGAR